jgi:hypothetical protein
LHLTHVAFSPDGKEVLLSYSGEHVYLFDVDPGMIGWIPLFILILIISLSHYFFFQSTASVDILNSILVNVSVYVFRQHEFSEIHSR